MRILLWSIIWLALQTGLGRSERELYLLGLYPETGGWSLPLGPLCAEMALEHINLRQDLLQGYELKIEWRDSACSDKVALGSFINALNSNRTYIGVFGPGCSVAAVAIANISPTYGLVTFSYSAGSPSLEDQLRYEYFIRGTISDTNIAVGRINFMKSYGWTRVAIINQQEEIFVYNSLIVEQVLTELGIDYRTSTFDTRSLNVELQIKNAITLISELGYRIIFANMYENALVQFVCHLKMSFEPLPYLTWLVVGWYTIGWDENAYEITNGRCTTQDIRDILNGAIGIIPYQLYNSILQSNSVTISGLTPHELYSSYKQRALNKHLNFETERDSLDAYLYDSLWTYALGINQTIADGHKPEDFNYTHFQFTQSLFVNTYSQQFAGWTGDVSYFGSERRAKTVQIAEFIDGNILYRGYYADFPANISEFANTTGVISNISTFEVWREDLASDGIENEFSSIVIFAIILGLAILLVIYTTVLIVVILIGVKKKLPPATQSEPLINIIMLASNYLTILIAVLLTVDGKFFGTLREDSPECIIYCHAQILLPVIASSILFGSVIAKASKYYIIVVKNRFKYIAWLQAKYLLLFPTALVLFDIVIMVSWGMIDPILYQSSVITSGLVDPPFYRTFRCVIFENVGFAVPLAVLNLIMVVVALFLAYHLRKVVNKSHRYSSAIVWVIYTTVVFTFIIVLVLIFVPYVDFRIGLSASMTLLAAFTLPSIVGLPIVYYLIKDPKGRTFYKSKSQSEFPEDTELLKLRIAALQRDLNACRDNEADNASNKIVMSNFVIDSSIPDSPVKMDPDTAMDGENSIAGANSMS